MKRISIFSIMALLVASLFILPACDSGGGGGGGATNNLVGTWTVVDSSYAIAIGHVLVFNANGTGTWEGHPITYHYNTTTGVLTVTGYGPAGPYTVSWVSSTKIHVVVPPTNYFVMVKS